MKTARLRFDREVPPWGVTGFLDSMTSNHLKLATVVEICWHFAEHRFDEDLILAERSALQFETTDYQHFENDEFRILAEKQANPKKFWNALLKHDRPVVFRRRTGGMATPLYDLNSDTAFKIRKLSNNSPVEISVSGLGEVITDLVYAHDREERQRAADAMEQIGRAARNYQEIAASSQIINDPRVPEGIRAYANQGLTQLLKHQATLNEKVGLRVLGIDQHG